MYITTHEETVGPTPEEVANRRVLVAEDDPDIARMLVSLVKSWGHQPILANDGPTALAALGGPGAPTRALVDWMMPGIVGLDVVRRHRRAGGRAHIVLLTARDRKEDVVLGLEAGADDYVVKPFDVAELRSRLLRTGHGPDARDSILEAGAIIGGRYRLEAPIGAGGMGRVWRATHVELGSEVAIKLLLASHAANPIARARFEAEARTTSLLRSPHLVPVFDYGVTSQGTPYLVMELLRGRTLASIVRERGPLPVPVVAAIAAQVARGLATAHAAGVVHRDVKPDNVFLESFPNDSLIVAPRSVKLIDFGVARALETRGSRTTTQGAFVGTLGYASPEQVLGGGISPSADVWALGATMIHALIGRSPIAEQAPSAMMLATVAGEIEVPSAVVPHLPIELDAWARRACSVHPESRFADTGALARALRKIVRATSPIVAPASVVPVPATLTRAEELHAASRPTTAGGTGIVRWIAARRRALAPSLVAASIVLCAAFVAHH